ncbi:hypothetical protein D3C76_1728330 [compost metagenome]
MIQLLKSLSPYIPVILAIIRFMLDEIRYYCKRSKERKDYRKQPEPTTKENGAYPPRKDKHHKR